MEGTASADLELLWIRQIAAGDRDAFENLYKAYAPRLFRYLYNMITDAAAAEELTNDVMLAAWKGAASFRGDSRPSTWLFGIAHHKALNELRRKHPVTVDEEEASRMADSAEGPEQVV